MTRNSRILLALVAAAAVLGGYWHFVLGPKREQAAELGRRIDAAEAAVQQARATVARYSGAREAYQANYAALVRLGKAVPGDDDLRSLIVQLDAAAKRSRVDFRDVEVSSGTGEPTVGGSTESELPPGAVAVGSGGLSAIPLKFTFTGRYAGLGGFLSRLERFVTVRGERVRVTGRLLRVESIHLAPSSGGYPSIQAEIDASSYLADPPDPVGGAPPAPAPSSETTEGGAPVTAAATTGELR